MSHTVSHMVLKRVVLTKIKLENIQTYFVLLEKCWLHILVSICKRNFFRGWVLSYSLSDFFLRAVTARVVDAFGEVLDEADALSDPDLLLLGQLGGQAGLAGRGVVHRHMDLLLHNGK